MKKAQNKRTHKSRVDASRKHLSGDEITTMNNKRRHENRIDFLKERKSIQTYRNMKWRELTPKQQLKALDKRLGRNKGAKQQRKRIEEKLAA